MMRWMVPILLAAMMLSAFSGVAQGGINFAPGALALKFDRFNPASKLGQIFSPVGPQQSVEVAAAVRSHSLDRNQFNSRQLGNDGARLQPGIEGLRRLYGQHGLCPDLEGRACLAALVRSRLRIDPDEDEQRHEDDQAGGARGTQGDQMAIPSLNRASIGCAGQCEGGRR